MAILSPQPRLRFFDSAANPLSGGKLWTFVAGTSTPLPTYADSSGATANTNPIVLDSSGEADVWLQGGSYKIRLEDANGAEIWTVDNVSGGGIFEVVRFVDQFMGASVTAQIDAAVADVGSNPGIVVIPSSVASGSPTSVPNNVVLVDLRGTGAGTPYGNGITLNGQTAGVHSMLRVSNQRTDPDRSEEVITVVGSFTGSMPGSGTDSVQAVTGVSQTSGAITTAAAVNIAAIEGGADLNSTGGTITAAIGVNGWANTEVGSTTTVGKLVGVLGQAPVKNGSGAITEAYGGEFIQPATIATKVGALHAIGNIVQTNAFGYNVEDHAGAQQPFLQTDASDNVFLNDIGGSIFLRNKVGTQYVKMSGGNLVEIDPNIAGIPLNVSSVVVKTANGASWTEGSASEEITLSTSGTTTDSAANLLPGNSIIEAVAARVTTTITTATDWKLGDAAQSARFAGANTNLTVGTTALGLSQWNPTVATADLGPGQGSAAKLRITTTGTPGAGKIRVTVFFRTFIPPTS